MWATLYTDASYAANTGGGWSVWIRSELARIVLSGRCPDDVKDSLAAEMYAALKGLQTIACDPLHFGKVEGVCLKSDCQAVVGGLKFRSEVHYKNPIVQKLLEDARLVIESNEWKIKVQWVKGHRQGDETSAYLNRKVDEFARVGRVGDERRQVNVRTKVAESES